MPAGETDFEIGASFASLLTQVLEESNEVSDLGIITLVHGVNEEDSRPGLGGCKDCTEEILQLFMVSCRRLLKYGLLLKGGR